MNSKKYVCEDCGKILSIHRRRRHKDRCWPRGPVIVGAPSSRSRSFRSVWPYSRLRSVSKY